MKVYAMHCEHDTLQWIIRGHARSSNCWHEFSIHTLCFISDELSKISIRDYYFWYSSSVKCNMHGSTMRKSQSECDRTNFPLYQEALQVREPKDSIHCC